MVSSTFHARSAAAYEQFMGRWSRQLSKQFIEFTGASRGEKILDVGCGTGSLSFALAEVASVSAVIGVDLSDVYLEEANRVNRDARLVFQKGDATALQFGDASFDRALSMLVLQFVPNADLAVSEMRRVVRSGGVVAAAVWDSYGGVPAQRMLWDVAASLSLASSKNLSDYFFRPMTQPKALATTWTRQGLLNVQQSSLTMRTDFVNFNDYWGPIAAGESSLGKFVTSLAAAEQERLKEGVRITFLGGQPDGARSFASTAWVCKGVVR